MFENSNKSQYFRLQTNGNSESLTNTRTWPSQPCWFATNDSPYSSPVSSISSVSPTDPPNSPYTILLNLASVSEYLQSFRNNPSSSLLYSIKDRLLSCCSLGFLWDAVELSVSYNRRIMNKMLQGTILRWFLCVMLYIGLSCIRAGFSWSGAYAWDEALVLWVASGNYALLIWILVEKLKRSLVGTTLFQRLERIASYTHPCWPVPPYKIRIPSIFVIFSA